MILRSSQNHAVSAFDIVPQPENVLRICVLVFLPIAKDQLILSEVNQFRLGTGITGAPQGDLQGHPRVATRAEASANGHDPNLVSCFFVLSHVDYLRRGNKTKPSRSTKVLAWLVWGLIQAFPLVQRNYTNLRSPFVWKLGQELQKVPVRVVEVEGSRWHPTKNAGHVGDLPEKVAQLNPSLLGGSHRAAEIGAVDLEGEMLGNHPVLGVRSLGPGWFLPQTQGGPALPAHPVESDAARLLLHGKL